MTYLPTADCSIDAPVSETDIALIKQGQKAEVRVQALPGRTFDARVERIAIEPQKKGAVVLYPVTLFVDNADGALLPGMSARARERSRPSERNRSTTSTTSW